MAEANATEPTSEQFAMRIAGALMAEDLHGASMPVPVHFQEGNGSEVLPVDPEEELVWRAIRMWPREGSQGVHATAAHVLELLPAMPGPSPGHRGAEGGYGTILNKSGFREMAAQSILLAHGGEGLFSNFVETMVEANSMGFENRLASNKDDKGEIVEKTGPPWVEIFNTFNRMVNADFKTGQSLPGKTRGIDVYQSKFVWQWWVTGLVVVLQIWDEVQIEELKFRKVKIPRTMTILDPLRIDLDDFDGKGLVYYEYNGKQKAPMLKELTLLEQASTPQNDKTKLHSFFGLYPAEKDLNRQDPAQMWTPSREQAIKMFRNKSKVPLPPGHFKVCRRLFNDNEIYPVPFAVRLFPAINDKRMLRNMDRSIIRKVVMMILQISMKTQEKNRPRALHIEKTVKAMEQQLTSDPEYVQVVALPEGTDMKWVVPDPGAILDIDKYRATNFEILSSMVGLVASQILDGGGQMDLSLIGEQLWRKNQHCLHVFRGHMLENYDQIRRMSGIKKIKPGDILLIFKQFNPFTSDAYRVFIGNMVARGLLPVSLAVDHLNEDMGTVIQELIRQVDLQDRYGIFQAPPVQQAAVTTQEPVPGSDPNDNGDRPTRKVVKQGPNMGRPPGKVDSDKRVRDPKNVKDKPAPSQDK